MAYSLLHLIFFAIHLPISSFAQTTGNISVGATLVATDRNPVAWVSPSGDFAFGFQKLQDKSDLFVLSIWFNKIPDKTIVWYEKKVNPVKAGSKIELSSDGGLVLKDPQNRQLWTPDGVADQVAHGYMNDTGNFVLVRADSVWIWESFKDPADTLLPTQVMEVGGVLTSRRSQTNFSSGRFEFRLLNDGNLVLNTRNVESGFQEKAYYASGTNNQSNPSNSGSQVIFNQTGHMFILRRNQQRLDLTAKLTFPVADYYHRATLTFDGVFTQYVHPKRFTGTPNWTVLWYKPDNICFDITADIGSGACGFNSVCTRDDYGRPICKCPEGYSLLDPGDEYGTCKPNFMLSCEDDDKGGSGADLYDFIDLIGTNWPLADYERLTPSDEENCKKSCLADCFCAVAILGGENCWKKRLPFSNGRKDARDTGTRAFLKYRKGSVPPRANQNPILDPKKDQGNLIILGSVLLGSSLFVNLLLGVGACLGCFLIHQKKILKLWPVNKDVGNNLRCFTYKELVGATNGFKEELGRGAFGIVYKGTVAVDSTYVAVAVKKLDRVAQNTEEEFRTEVNVIGQIRHKNLVRLLGFCDEGQHRLLVYEYMSNGTLASNLFGEEKLGWQQRIQITQGIARGITYLHEECGNQIIHCDIKSQNILLDDYHNVRISDFGLAKLLMLDQSKTNTGIRGTKGYVAPEWFKNNQVNAKVDVYSFGVLLLEIISCRRNLEDLESYGEGKAILTDWVWDMFEEGKLKDLVENDEEALNDLDTLKRLVMIGIWCIQEDPSQRPTMRRVTQMLEGVVEVINPPCPFLSSLYCT